MWLVNCSFERECWDEPIFDLLSRDNSNSLQYTKRSTWHYNPSTWHPLLPRGSVTQIMNFMYLTPRTTARIIIRFLLWVSSPLTWHLSRYSHNEQSSESRSSTARLCNLTISIVIIINIIVSSITLLVSFLPRLGVHSTCPRSTKSIHSRTIMAI